MSRGYYRKPQRFGNKRRTQREKNAAALQFVVQADERRSDEEIAKSLQTSYGFGPAEAALFVQQNRPR